ncbi:hypothetical protein HBA55_02655 [Pseudomaricurvus alkylphenolicus]|uniref:hypothetical protein n=1 Tax=Pseudomaricurvus alkylphenolicus TaxID=1306991 RepID=UPI001421D30A|nr:hypothetical protein [Pseudomaricurvus alkylphenolicus]NIB38465.1 hypothetical protein [Pseudomaricurvus alkylphenolicus]
MKPQNINRWSLLKDTAIFQFKLSVDALRACVLSPVSILCALIDFINPQPPEKTLYYKLMILGHQSDSWINVFGIRCKNSNLSEDHIDVLFAILEDAIKEQQSNGGLTASAQRSIDRLICKIMDIKSNAAKSPTNN